MSCCFSFLFQVVKKNVFFVLFCFFGICREPITASWEGTELLQENNPCLCPTEWMWPIGPSAELYMGIE